MNPQNNSTRVLAEQIGYLFLQNIEQAEVIRTLQQELLTLRAEMGEAPKQNTDK